MLRMFARGKLASSAGLIVAASLRSSSIVMLVSKYFRFISLDIPFYILMYFVEIPAYIFLLVRSSIKMTVAST